MIVGCRTALRAFAQTISRLAGLMAESSDVRGDDTTNCPRSSLSGSSTNKTPDFHLKSGVCGFEQDRILMRATWIWKRLRRSIPPPRLAPRSNPPSNGSRTVYALRPPGTVSRVMDIAKVPCRVF